MSELWTVEQAACWQRLRDYDFDDPEHHLSFTDRLARENNWSREYAARTIDEYRCFCWLAVHADHPVTPSDAVDQVWHLHLTYSHDYWERFCPDILGQNFHHGPTKGGVTEGDKFAVWYGKTLLSYREAFGVRPDDIWPKPVERFADADQFVRVNRANVLILPRPPISAHHLSLAALAGLVLFFFALAASIPSIQTFASFLGLLTMVVLIGLAFGVLDSPLKRKRKGHGHTGTGCGGGSGCGGCGGCGG